MRTHLFGVIKKRSQLIIKEETVVEARFVILRGVRANQRALNHRRCLYRTADFPRRSLAASSTFRPGAAGNALRADTEWRTGSTGVTTLPANGEENQQYDKGNGDG